jgi:hypothetical protein
MTFWQLAQSWPHRKQFGICVDKCHRCQLEKLLREKARYYEAISKCGMVRPMVSTKSVLDDLGVPESEEK